MRIPLETEVYFSMEHASKYVDQFLNSSDAIRLLEAVEFLKNVAIGSNKQKEAIIEKSLVPRFLQILEAFAGSPDHEELLCETTSAINSLSKGTEDQVKSLVTAGAVPVILTLVMSPNTTVKHMSILLRTLASLFKSKYAPHSLVYEWTGSDGTETLIDKLLALSAPLSQPYANQQAVCSIFALTIQEYGDRQRSLSACGAIPVVADLVMSNSFNVQVAALDLLSKMTYNNMEVSKIVVTTIPTSRYQTRQQTAFQTVPDILTEMMSQEGSREMQLLAAKCMTFLYRSEVICAEDKRIVYKTLPTLIRCCKEAVNGIMEVDEPVTCNLEEAASRAEAAEMLAFLTETDTQLQQIAATCDQVISAVGDLLKFHATVPSFGCCSEEVTASSCLTPAAARRLDQGIRVQNEMKQAAFKVFASLTANDEEVRKRVLDMDNIMDHVVSGLKSQDEKLRFASLKCLHSLSRSVQQFKQHFPEQTIWPPLKNLLTSSNQQITLLASSTLCNLLSEVTPSKAHFIDRGTMDTLAGLTTREEPTLRINGVLALMNMVHKAEQQTKLQILQTLGMDGIFKLLNDDSEKVVIKTLGLLRNLLTTKSHIDHIMSLHGKDIIDSLLIIIDSVSHSIDVKEQAFCVLANIADGDCSKDLIMTNDEILNRLLGILEEGEEVAISDVSSSIDVKRPITKLQIAVTYCITNLVWAGEDGSSERQAKMRDCGILKCLNNLVESSDTDLFHKVKTALQQFPNKSLN